MSNIILEQFTKKATEMEKYSDAPIEVIDRFKGTFLIGDDNIDIITSIWQEHGFASYKNGLFSMVNPLEYTKIAHQFHNISISENAIVFAKTSVGNLFLFDRLDIGDSIIHLNVHKRERNIVSTSFEVFFEFNMFAESYWKRECYGKFELKVIEKYGRLEYDECYAFVPALALGGTESIKKIQKVKVKEHLEFLAQLD